MAITLTQWNKCIIKEGGYDIHKVFLNSQVM